MAIKHYFIHDNGGRPFLVSIDKLNVKVYKKSNSDDEDVKNYSKLIDTFTAKKILIGKSSGKSETCDHAEKDAKLFDGNSILLQITNTKYIFIGHEIFSFEMNDELDKFYSPVGNNDVPYPLVLGKEYVYFLLDKKYVARDLFPKNQVWEDAYIPWYGIFISGKGWKSDYEPYSKKMKIKMIQKRIF